MVMLTNLLKLPIKEKLVCFIDTIILILLLTFYYLYSVLDKQIFAIIFIIFVLSSLITKFYLHKKCNCFVSTYFFVIKDSIIIIFITIIFALFILIKGLFSLEYSSELAYHLVFINYIAILFYINLYSLRRKNT